MIEGQDEQGLHVLYDDRLAAVMVKLGSMHGEEQGFWNLEIGFGACIGRPATFKDLSSALRWVGERCLDDPDVVEREIVELQRSR